MPSSGQIGGTLTARDLCTAAARDLGAYSAGETLSAADGEDMMLRLTWMLKSWAAKGANLWRQAEDSVTFAQGVATVTLDPRCLDVLEARLVQSATNQLPMQRWELGEYMRVPNKTSESPTPLSYYLRKGVGGVEMTLWPVPRQEVTVDYTYSRVTEDVTDLNQTIDIPQEWMETVWTNLAVRCAPLFGVARMDPATVSMIAARAAELERELLDADRPSSVYFSNINAEYG